MGAAVVEAGGYRIGEGDTAAAVAAAVVVGRGYRTPVRLCLGAGRRALDLVAGHRGSARVRASRMRGRDWIGQGVGSSLGGCTPLEIGTGYVAPVLVLGGIPGAGGRSERSGRSGSKVCLGRLILAEVIQGAAEDWVFAEANATQGQRARARSCLEVNGQDDGTTRGSRNHCSAGTPAAAFGKLCSRWGRGLARVGLASRA